MCEHPQSAWVGTANGIHCSICGAVIDLGKKPEPVKAPEPEQKAEPAEEKPVQKQEKKPAKKISAGGRKNAGSK